MWIVSAGYAIRVFSSFQNFMSRNVYREHVTGGIPVPRLVGWKRSWKMFGVELGRQLAVFRRAATRAAADQVLLRPTLPKTSLRRDMTIDTSSNGPFNWVGGARCNPVDNVGNSGNISPRTGKLLCTIPSSGSQEVERAVAVAREAFPAWAALSGMERGQLLTRFVLFLTPQPQPEAKHICPNQILFNNFIFDIKLPHLEMGSKKQNGNLEWNFP